MVPSIHPACLRPDSEIVVYTGVKAVERPVYIRAGTEVFMHDRNRTNAIAAIGIYYRREAKGYINYNWLVAYITHYFRPWLLASRHNSHIAVVSPSVLDLEDLPGIMVLWFLVWLFFEARLDCWWARVELRRVCDQAEKSGDDFYQQMNQKQVLLDCWLLLEADVVAAAACVVVVAPH